MRIQATEKETLNSILDYLLYFGYFVWRNNTGALLTQKGQFMRFGKQGSPDIIGLTQKGLFLGIEVKSGNKKQTEQQIEFQEAVETRGGVYMVARALEDVISGLKGL